MRPITSKLSMLFCAGLLAGCMSQTGDRATSHPDLPRLAGEAAEVARLTPALARKGLNVAAVPASRAAALVQFCGGHADALALSSDMTDSEVTRCSAAGGHWSAVSSEGANVYLSPGFNAQHSGFDWWG